MQVPVYTSPKIERFPANCPTPPRENAEPIESSEGAEPNLTEQSPPPQPEVPVSDFTKEWVEDRLQKLEASTSERIDDRIQEFDDKAVQPFKNRQQRILDSALKFADVTRHLLERNQERFSELGEGLQEEAVQRDKFVQRTAILEDVTSDLKKDFDRLERDTDQRLTAMSVDLVGTTLDRVNAVAAAVAADAQVAKRIQDALDAEMSKEKEAPRPTPLIEEEAEAERLRIAEAKYPGFAEKVAAQAAEDAARLEREARRLDGFAEENKKKKAVASASAPKKRKREAPKKEALKKVQIAELLREVSKPVIPSASQQADQIEDEVEEQLRSQSTRRRSSEPTGQQQPKKKKSLYDFTDSD
ncbi:translation initiation factor IF-2-like [Impatiens glandulifera]|uniref:translation initiation factor IF-2-like n=1 Tax=Impatiens glandulifera TaxID=253017 RepID=UPI001FB0DC7A|nr:translation initiation factor IF-2-like [Impatiens glandulifera]